MYLPQMNSYGRDYVLNRTTVACTSVQEAQ